MVIDRIKTQRVSEWVRPQHIKFITIPDDNDDGDEREMITCNFSERINEWVSERESGTILSSILSTNLMGTSSHR